jgi:hypothetical protein
MKALDIATERSLNGFVADVAVMQKGGSYHEEDGTFCRAVTNANTGKRYILQGQLVRCAKSGKFVKLEEVML